MVMNEVQQNFVRRSTLTLQIIAGALMMGVVTFLAVVLLVIPAPDQANQELLQTYLAAGFACVALPAAFLVPGFMGTWVERNLIEGKEFPPHLQANIRPEMGDLGPLVYLYQTRMIIGMALLEGAAFYNLVVYMIERQPVNLWITGMLLAAIVLKFPNRGRLENWLEDELKRIEEERSLRA